MLRFALTLALIMPISVAIADVTGKPRVIDGDTVEIAGERIRLNGIDTPEANQSCLDDTGKRWRCGREATHALSTIVGDQAITCKGDERDKYKRLIAVCFAGGKYVGEWKDGLLHGQGTLTFGPLRYQSPN